jgi:RNA polymerase-binding protein DksA
VRSEELQQWKEKLLLERDSIRRALDQQRSITAATAFDSSGEISAHSSHIADQGTETMEREKAFLFIAQKRERLEEVEQALSRIEAGTFGVCESCGENIPARRLERIPTASLCVPCKEELEKVRR